MLLTSGLIFMGSSQISFRDKSKETERSESVEIVEQKQFQNLLADLTQHNNNVKQSVALSNEEYLKTQSCLIRNVFYEAPRYFPGMEKQQKYANLVNPADFDTDDDRYKAIKATLLDKIKRERVRVINVTTNRVKSRKYSDKYCQVVYEYKQFSWTLDPSKVSTSLYKKFEGKAIELANVEEIKKLVDHELNIGFPDITNGATFYHTHWVFPKWSSHKELKVASLWHKYYAEPQ